MLRRSSQRHKSMTLIIQVEVSSCVLNTLERHTVVGVYLYARWDVTEVDVSRTRPLHRSVLRLA
jgi:hypothetical protein